MSEEYRTSTYSSDIILNWNDMRNKFGYNLLCEMLGRLPTAMNMYEEKEEKNLPVLDARYP